jgi:hypothetical protein
MRVELSKELLEKGVSERDVLNMYKALNKRVYIEVVHIGLDEFNELVRAAYAEERKRGRRVDLWSRWCN